MGGPSVRVDVTVAGVEGWWREIFLLHLRQLGADLASDLGVGNTTFDFVVVDGPERRLRLNGATGRHPPAPAKDRADPLPEGPRAVARWVIDVLERNREMTASALGATLEPTTTGSVSVALGVGLGSASQSALAPATLGLAGGRHARTAGRWALRLLESSRRRVPALLADSLESAAGVAGALALSGTGAVSGDSPLTQSLETVRRSLFDELGVLVPRIDLGLDPTLDSHELRIGINGLRGAPIEIAPDGGPAAIAQTVSSALRRRAHELVTAEMLEASLASLEPFFPDVVAAIQGRSEDLVELCRQLVKESVSIRDLRAIAELLLSLRPVARIGASMDAIGPAVGVKVETAGGRGLEADLARLESVRSGLARHICARLATQGRLPAVRVDPALEDALDPSVPFDWPWSLSRQLHGAAVILVGPRRRRALWERIRLELPDLSVLSTSEVAREVTVEELGVVTREGAGDRTL